jgi:hypothetical protein
VDELTTTTGIVALAAAGLALATLALAIVLAVRLRHLRQNQAAVFGDHGQRDLVRHAAELDEAFRVLRDHVDVVHTTIDGRLAEVEARLDHAIIYRGLVRFDAYNEMSGRQSTSIALLDESGSGIVVSSIHHRDQARLYAKRVHHGESDLELAPEEEEAVRMAMAAPAGRDGAARG